MRESWIIKQHSLHQLSSAQISPVGRDDGLAGAGHDDQSDCDCDSPGWLILCVKIN